MRNGATDLSAIASSLTPVNVFSLTSTIDRPLVYALVMLLANGNSDPPLPPVTAMNPSCTPVAPPDEETLRSSKLTVAPSMLVSVVLKASSGFITRDDIETVAFPVLFCCPFTTWSSPGMRATESIVDKSESVFSSRSAFASSVLVAAVVPVLLEAAVSKFDIAPLADATVSPSSPVAFAVELASNEFVMAPRRSSVLDFTFVVISAGREAAVRISAKLAITGADKEEADDSPLEGLVTETLATLFSRSSRSSAADESVVCAKPESDERNDASAATSVTNDCVSPSSSRSVNARLDLVRLRVVGCVTFNAK
mmetsp:Transcript_25968/g.35972  ORF Transcript_25968/g.35972 Transcript_25968/m.35972 type:complete len:311 (+) Transcript_25968:546-1478(+)